MALVLFIEFVFEIAKTSLQKHIKKCLPLKFIVKLRGFEKRKTIYQMWFNN